MVWSLVRPFVRMVTSNNKLIYAPRCVNTNNCKSLFYNKYCTQVLLTEDEDRMETIIKEVAKGDEEIEKKMRLCMLEMDVLHQDGKRAPNPSFLKKQHWDYLVTVKSRSGRNKYYLYLFEIEMKTLKKKATQAENAKILKEKQIEMKKERLEKMEKNEVPASYGLQDQSLFLRIYESSINKGDNLRLHQAAMFGQKIIIDCSYDNHMSYKEQSNAGNQLTLLFAENRVQRDPFDIHFCNVNWETETFRKVQRNIPTYHEPWFPINIHKESYLDLFPKDKLVYLTPHCRRELTEFDHDACYIIGCMVDKTNTEPLSLAKAKEHNLKVAKLPLDRYLQWTGGSGKCLTLNQVLSILLCIKETGDWNEALKFVPRRKLHDANNYFDNTRNIGVTQFSARKQQNFAKLSNSNIEGAASYSKQRTDRRRTDVRSIFNDNEDKY